MEMSDGIDYLIVQNYHEKQKCNTNKTHQIIPNFNIYYNESKEESSKQRDEILNVANNIPFNNVWKNSSNKTFQNIEDSESRVEDTYNRESANLNFNVSNRKYLPPFYAKKSYLIPKILSSSLAVKNRQSDLTVYALDFGISETMNYKTKFPQTLHYSRVCPQQPPYIAPLLIGLLFELEKHLPPISKITSGSSQQTLESADALFDTMLTVHINENIPKHISQIFYLNVTVKVLTNTLQIFFQRLQYPLFLATSEFCHIVTSNKYDIKFIQFGCYKFDEDSEFIQSLTKCLAISTNFQIANLTYFLEICQKWMRLQIKYELNRKPMAKAEKIYEDAAANLAMVFGKTLVGIPKSFIAYKIMNSALPLVDDIRRIILYFLLGIPPFEFHHLWSISSLCFEDKVRKNKCIRGAFLERIVNTGPMEALPSL